MLFRISVVWMIVSLGSISVLADDSQLSNERIYVKDEFQAVVPKLQWFDETTKLISVEDKELILEDPLSGNKETLIRREWLVPEGEVSPISIESWEFTKNKTGLLIFTNSKRVWRHSAQGDYWFLDLNTKKLTKLGENAKPQTLMFAKLSPDGKSAAYVRENNIYLENLETHDIKPLTTTGGERFINGAFDWVYEEEFGLTNGFCWSPDSRSIAFWELDTEGEPLFSMVDNTSEFYPVVKQFKYPRPGEINAAARIGIVAIDTGRCVWASLPGNPREHYITQLHWPKRLVVQQFNRAQNQMTLFQVNPSSGEAVALLTDTDDTWVDMRPIRFFDDGVQLLFESERNGRRQIFRQTVSDTANFFAVTPSEIDVIRFVAFDDESTDVYYYASPDHAAQQYLYHGSQRITPESQPGFHEYEVSHDCTMAVHRYSWFGMPPMCEIVELPSHKQVRPIENNLALCEKLQTLGLGKTEFFQIEIEKNVKVDSWCIYPHDFDPSKKYPVLVYVYGEPAGQTVLDRWGGNGYLWHQMFTQKGYVVMSFDNRGTPAPKGRDWRKAIYKKIGSLGPSDQAKAIQKTVERHSYLDPKRIGIWGWSGGGSMTLHAMLQYPEIYTVGIAVAPVPDERYYDTIYQERYMGNPKTEDAEVYRRSSPITYAQNLRGKLLLIHGTGDDNCHYQTMELFINELVKHDKQFTMMAYPGRSHSIFEGEGTTLHLRNLMMRFLEENL